MRVLLVSSHGSDRTYGGAERYVDDLAGALRARGDEPLVLSGFPVPDGSAAASVTLHATDWRDDRVRRARNHVDDWVAEPWPRVEAILAELAPDLVHTSNLPGISTGIWEQARRLGIPVVHTLHDYYLLCPRTSLTRADGSPCRPNPLLCGLRTRRLGRWAGAVAVVVGVSAHVLGRHQGFFPASSERRMILAPLAPPPGAAGAPPRTPLAIVGYLGALTESKGVPVLLDAAPRLVELGVRVRIAGDGPLRDRVAAAPGVEYAGRVQTEAVPAFLAGCDLGLVTSVWEEPGLTYVLFEWLAAGRRVLCTRRGGLSEAAAIGGVSAFDATADGLVAAVAGLRDAARWMPLVDAVPDAAALGDFDRWFGEHLDAYARALARAGRAGR
jgi:glycosyltransferase involved in cell wall biosynthesis